MNNSMNQQLLLLMLLGLLFVLPSFIQALYRIHKKYSVKSKIIKLANSSNSMTPTDFFKMRNMTLGGKGRPKIALRYDYAGVYILLNKDKDKYYIGQGKKVIDRVNNHFTGKGNGDVYADYKYGDKFIIKTIKINNSGFKSLNELEKYAISTFKGYSKGYNKTRGNKN